MTAALQDLSFSGNRAWDALNPTWPDGQRLLPRTYERAPPIAEAALGLMSLLLAMLLLIATGLGKLRPSPVSTEMRFAWAGEKPWGLAK